MTNGKDELMKQREKHNNYESAFVEKYVKVAQDYQQELESMRSADGEEFSILKMRWVENVCLLLPFVHCQGACLSCSHDFAVQLQSVHLIVVTKIISGSVHAS